MNLERGYTEAEYRDFVLRKMKVGRTYKLWGWKSSDDPTRPKLQTKFRRKLKVLQLNRHIVHFVDEAGRNVCYPYVEVYQMIRGDVG